MSIANLHVFRPPAYQTARKSGTITPMSSEPPIDPAQESPEHKAALRFLFGRVDYERLTDVPYLPDHFKLDRMRELLDRLGNPQDRMPIVHIAGTKGKGSTAAMLAAILTAAGIRCGVYSSPHLDRIEERIAVDSQPCTADELVELIRRIRPVVETMDGGQSENGPTYFEISTAMALLHFADRGVGAAVLEVGLGGRLDSTNVCSPKLTLVESSRQATRQYLGLDRPGEGRHRQAGRAADKWRP